MTEKLKIMRVSHVFTPSFVAKLALQAKGFNNLSFFEQRSHLISLKVDSSSALSRELGKRGHIVEDFYFDLEIPQKQWAKENNVQWNDSDWQNQILLNQIGIVKPDILFFQKTPKLPRSTLFNLKKQFRFLKKIVYHTAYLGASGSLGYVDHLLVGTPGLAHRYSVKGYKPEVFYQYFDSSILDHVKGQEDSKLFSFTFLGSSGFGGGFLHSDRYEILKFLAENSEIMMWLSEPEILNAKQTNKDLVRNSIKMVLKKIPRRLLNWIRDVFCGFEVLQNIIDESIREKDFHREGRSLPSKPLRDLFPEKVRNGLMGLEYYKVINKSKISFTKAGNSLFDKRNNPQGDIGAIRLFEATGLGSCLISDTGPNMADLFEENKEVVTYGSREEALEKVRFLINNEKIRTEIAKAGQARTLKDHTEKNRADQFEATVLI